MLLKIINTIQIKYAKGIASISILKDKRLALSSYDGSILIYNESYELHLHIQNAHDLGICSLCVLRNGELASSSADKTIKIWKINENDYELIQTLKGHTGIVRKVIELQDGKICSCSDDKTVKIWVDYYCASTLVGHSSYIKSIIEMKEYIASISDSASTSDSTPTSASNSSPYNGELIIWDKITYKCIKTINNVYCYLENGLSKLTNSILLVGGWDVIFVVNFQTFEISLLKNPLIRNIFCLNALSNGLVLIGNDEGEIMCYDLLSDLVISKKKFHNDSLYCLIETEDNQIISFSYDQIIKIYKLI